MPTQQLQPRRRGSTVAQAVETEQKPTPKAAQPQAAPQQLPKDTVNISSAAKSAAQAAAQSALQEATESAAQTAKEARGGDPPAIKLLAKHAAAKKA
jgi:hypothetical protein